MNSTAAHSELRQSLAQAAAMWVADHGLDYAAAKSRAIESAVGKQRLPASDIPDSDDIDLALLEHLELFDGLAHAERLESLCASALRVMEVLGDFQVLVTGAAWKGIASEQAFVHLQVFADNGKEVEYCLMNQGIRFEVGELPRARGFTAGLVPALRLDHKNNPVVLAIYDFDDLRGALKTQDKWGRPVRGKREQLLASLDQTPQKQPIP